MPSTQQGSEEHALSDDAIMALLAFAGWDVRYDQEQDEWLVRPPTKRPDDFSPYACFMSLRDAGEYFLTYQRAYHANP